MEQRLLTIFSIVGPHCIEPIDGAAPVACVEPGIVDIRRGVAQLRRVAHITMDGAVDSALDPRPRADSEDGYAGSMVAGWPDDSALCCANV